MLRPRHREQESWPVHVLSKGTLNQHITDMSMACWQIDKPLEEHYWVSRAWSIHVHLVVFSCAHWLVPFVTGSWEGMVRERRCICTVILWFRISDIIGFISSRLRTGWKNLPVHYCCWHQYSWGWVVGNDEPPFLTLSPEAMGSWKVAQIGSTISCALAESISLTVVNTLLATAW